MPETPRIIRELTDQTLPDFLFAVITEQRKSVSTLVDALNEAKNGINQLSISAERSEESRRQVETLLERQSLVENDIKFDLTQCRQHNEVLQGQVKTLEENLDQTDERLRVAIEDRDAMQDACGHHTATIHALTREIAMRLEDVSAFKIQLASWTEAETKRTSALQQRLDEAIHVNEMLSNAYVRLRVILHADKLPDGVECTPDNIYAFTEQRARELVGFRDKVYNSPAVAWMNAKKDMTYVKFNEDDIPLIVAPTPAPTRAAGTLACVVPTETPVAVTNELKAGRITSDRLATICTYQPGNVIPPLDADLTAED